MNKCTTVQGFSARLTRGAAAGALAVSVCGTAQALPAGRMTLDYNSYSHGEKFKTPVELVTGVTISAVNAGDGDSPLTIFDTGETSMEDPDLLWASDNNWDAGNLKTAAADPGNVVIIAETGHGTDSDNVDGTVSDPDDEADHPAGSLTYEFDTPIYDFGFDLIDIEVDSEVTLDKNGDPESGYFAGFWSGGGEIGRVGFGAFTDSSSAFYDSTVAFGNHSANEIEPIKAQAFGETSFDKVTLNLGGSGAIDNTNFEVAPEPAAVMAGLVSFGVLGLRRRRGPVDRP